MKPENCRKRFHGNPCVFELKYTTAESDGVAVRGWFCMSHQLWTYEFSIKTEYHFDDGEVLTLPVQ